MSTAIAVWATPDGQTVTGTIRVGVVAYHSTGILRVDFDVDGGATTSVYVETANPDDTDYLGRSEYEFVYTIDTTALVNGTRTVHATAYPNTGTAAALPDLVLQVANGSSFDTRYVATTGGDAGHTGLTDDPWLTLTYAISNVGDGGTIKVRTGSYALPDTGTAPTKYVTIEPDTAATVTIASGVGTCRRSYVKFKNINFDHHTALSVVTISEAYNHVWFSGCTFTGRARADYTSQAVYGVNIPAPAGGTTANNCTIENCVATGCTFGFCLGGNGRHILRGCTINYPVDGIKLQCGDSLVTGTKVLDASTPIGDSTNHADCLACDSGDFTNQIIRNNLFIAYIVDPTDVGAGQCIKWDDNVGAAGRDVNFTNIAVINNVFCADEGAGVPIAMRHDLSGSPPRVGHFVNVLFEHNTTWKPETGAIKTVVFIETGDVGHYTDVVIRNNAIGRYDVGDGDMADQTGVVADYNFFFDGSGTEVLEAHSIKSATPAFLDETGLNFMLSASSPLIGVGTTASGINYDNAWATRSAAPAAGAFEYLGNRKVMVKA
jgi:parallel beta-helix repeat protein